MLGYPGRLGQVLYRPFQYSFEYTVTEKAVSHVSLVPTSTTVLCVYWLTIPTNLRQLKLRWLLSGSTITPEAVEHWFFLRG